MNMPETIAALLRELQARKPLVHHITNYVTVNDCANMALAVGASPVMADDAAEAADMVQYASALVLNIGTLNSRTVESMLLAGKAARQRNIPVIFDPVGVGATPLRTTTAETIIRELGPAVIRGNMAEIKRIAGIDAAIRGVDSVADETDGEQVARELSQRLRCVVAVTGKVDIVARGQQLCRIYNGHSLLGRVTGTGCMATSLIGCFCAAGNDWFCGTVAGIALMGLAGEQAQALLGKNEGTGSFRIRLFDAVSLMTPAGLQTGIRIEMAE
ncbi:MAG TPA: hydroxyethylthiazole kinase [Patescibacteria group bacterium]|nr:hydroxyethylthiazole kinase [Patescibacteria group bacterium]